MGRELGKCEIAGAVFAPSPSLTMSLCFPLAGENGALLHRYFLLRGWDQDCGPGVCFPQGLVPAQWLECHGLHRSPQRVSQGCGACGGDGQLGMGAHSSGDTSSRTWSKALVCCCFFIPKREGRMVPCAGCSCVGFAAGSWWRDMVPHQMRRRRAGSEGIMSSFLSWWPGICHFSGHGAR